jgi:hypothetical protein
MCLILLGLAVLPERFAEAFGAALPFLRPLSPVHLPAVRAGRARCCGPIFSALGIIVVHLPTGGEFHQQSRQFVAKLKPDLRRQFLPTDSPLPRQFELSDFRLAPRTP